MGFQIHKRLHVLYFQIEVLFVVMIGVAIDWFTFCGFCGGVDSVILCPHASFTVDIPSLHHCTLKWIILSAAVVLCGPWLTAWIKELILTGGESLCTNGTARCFG